MADLDTAANCVRVWDGGRQRLWLQPAAAAEVALPLQWQSDAIADTQQASIPTAGIATTVRYWRHRVPRPDACSWTWSWQLAADRRLTVSAIDLPEADHKRSFTCLCDGINDAAAGLGMYPITGLAIAITAFNDDGRSSPEGLRLGAVVAFEATLMQLYRDGGVPFL